MENLIDYAGFDCINTIIPKKKREAIKRREIAETFNTINLFRIQYRLRNGKLPTEKEINKAIAKLDEYSIHQKDFI